MKLLLRVNAALLAVLFLHPSSSKARKTSKPYLHTKPRIHRELNDVGADEYRARQQKQQRLRHVSADPKSLARPQVQHRPYEPRIVGGKDASPNSYPFFVEWDGCGASLIWEDIILTAAHCNPICTETVLIGAYESGSTANGAEFRSITKRSTHPDYNDFTLDYDFLILKIDEKSTIDPVKLPTIQKPSDNEVLTVIGLGTLEQFGPESTILQEVNVTAVSHQTCNSQYDGGIVQEIMFCAGDDEGGKDSCQGDSGGPIVTSDGTQVGVVSFGEGCGEQGHPGVYARVSGVMDWINEQICELSDNPPPSCPERRRGLVGDSETVRVAVTINFDDFPEEISLQVLSETSNAVILNHPPGSFSCKASYTEELDLFPGSYRLEIGDIFADGLCCEYGEGSIEVHAIIPGLPNVVLAQSDGMFASTKTVSFVVPSASESTSESTSAPTSNSSCEDDDSETFSIDADVGEKGCSWLGLNLAYYEYLCEFLDVAYKCQKTCDVCEYFA